MRKTCCLTELTPLQMQQIQNLIELCRKKEPLHLGFPEDGSLFFLTWEEEELLSCLIVCKLQEDLWECYVFTHPDWRRKGLCRELLEALGQAAPEETELVFLCDHQSPDALAAFSAFGLDFWRTEYQMERPALPLPSSPTPASADSSLSLHTEEFQEDGVNGWLFSAVSRKGSSAIPVGLCRVLFYGHHRFYLYHVEIFSDFRGQGLGTWLVESVIRALPEDAQIFLQVCADNFPAVKLYKKTGFHITETLSYYLY